MAWRLCALLALILLESAALQLHTDLDRSRYEEGKRQFELVQQQSEMPRYGQCWRNAMRVIQTGCKRLTDGIQTRLAIAYLNCFLEIQDKPTYPCSERTEIKACVRDMRDADRASLTTFFTHTQNICYFLQAQVWREETEQTITRLAASSSQVAEQLESSHQLQKDMMEAQNHSLENQNKLMQKARGLNNIINASSQNVRILFEDLKQSTKEQRQIIGDLFDQLTKLQGTILGEVSGFYSIFYYLLSLLVCYLLTSAARTSGARVWLYLIMTVNVLMEQTVVRWLATLSIFMSEENQESEQLYWLQRHCRRLSILLAVLMLAVCVYMYQDINALNNRLLVEIRKQNSDLKKFFTGDVMPQPVKQEENTPHGHEDGASSDSDYTSDPDGDHGEESDADSDKTYILPENQETSDAESFMTVQNDGMSESDQTSLLCELHDLRNSTPMREMSNTVESWLNKSYQREDNSDSLVTGASPSRGSFYNLRPRKSGGSPGLSPAQLGESPRSFSRTVRQIQQIAEKNSRLIRAYQQHGQPLSSSNHMDLPTPWQSRLRGGSPRIANVSRADDVERSSVITRSSRSSSKR